MNCSTCSQKGSCTAICSRIEAVIRPSWSTSLRELSLGSLIEVVPSTQSYAPVNTLFPRFLVLKPTENRVLELYYQEGKSCRKISQIMHIKQTTVRSMLSRAYKKIATNRLLVEE